MISYQIYTDGSCRANGNGGIGIVWLKNGEKVFEYSKGYKNVTNNINTIELVPNNHRDKLFSDIMVNSNTILCIKHIKYSRFSIIIYYTIIIPS